MSHRPDPTRTGLPFLQHGIALGGVPAFGPCTDRVGLPVTHAQGATDLTHPKTDPVDHDRTTRRHAGEAMKNGANAVGIAGVAFAVIALIIGLAAFATSHVAAGSVAVVIAVAAGVAGAVWLRRTHQRVRAAELRWHQAHSDEPAPPPSS